MMRNGRCFIVSLHVINELHIPKEASKSNSYFYSKVSQIWSSNYDTMHMNAHKTVNSMACKCDLKWSETRPIRPINTFFFEPTLLMLTILGPRENQPTPNLVVVIHCILLFYLSYRAKISHIPWLHVSFCKMQLPNFLESVN